MKTDSVVNATPWIETTDTRTGEPVTMTWLEAVDEMFTHSPVISDVPGICRFLFTVYGAARSWVLSTEGVSTGKRLSAALDPSNAERFRSAYLEYLCGPQADTWFDATVFMQTPDLEIVSKSSKKTSATPDNRRALLDPGGTKFGTPVPSTLTSLKWCEYLPCLHMHPTGRTSNTNADFPDTTYPISSKAPGGGKAARIIHDAIRVFVLGETVYDTILRNLTEGMLGNDDTPSWENNPGLSRGKRPTGSVSYHTRMTSRVRPERDDDGMIYTFSWGLGDGYASPVFDANAILNTTSEKPTGPDFTLVSAIQLMLPSGNADCRVLERTKDSPRSMVPVIMYRTIRDSQSTKWLGVKYLSMNLPMNMRTLKSVTASTVSSLCQAAGVGESAAGTFAGTLYRALGYLVKSRAPLASAEKVRVRHLIEGELAHYIERSGRVCTYEDGDALVSEFSERIAALVESDCHRLLSETTIQAALPTSSGRRTPAQLAFDDTHKELNKLPTSVVRDDPDDDGDEDTELPSI